MAQPVVPTWRRAREARRLANVLRSHILRQYGTGQRFLSEQDLSREYAVSRNLARDALALLQAEGVISRQQGMGTFVASSKQLNGGRGPVRGFSLREGAYHEVLALGPIPATAPVADVLQVSTDESVVLLERRTVVAAEPVAIWTSYLPAAIAEELAPDDPRLCGDYYDVLDELLVDEGGVLGVEQNVDATIARGDAAQLLGVPEGSALIRVERRVFSGTKRVVDYGFGVLRPDRIAIGTWQTRGAAVVPALA